MGEDMAQLVWMESFDAGRCSATLKRLHDAVTC
jgi:hypothetical protein